MSHIVQMPALGESVTEGTVTRWLKNVGDQITEDEPLVEVSTDKVDTEIPAPYSGVLEQILVGEDETVDVGADLAVIGDGSGAAGAPPVADEVTPDVAPPPAESMPEINQAASDAPVAAAPPVEAAPTAEAAAPVEAAPTAEAAAPVEAAAPPVEAAPAEPAMPADSSPAADSGAGTGTEVTMPEMGESVTEGTVTRWIKNVGDTVAIDEPLVEIATDKVDAEVPSPVAGTVLQIVAQEDETVAVGSVLAVIGSGTPAAAPATPAPTPAPETAPVAAAPVAAPAPAPATATPAPAASTPAPEAAPYVAPSAGGTAGRSGYVTPVVRKLATDRGVDLSAVVGTGVGGRIRREDVLAAAAPLSEVPTTVPLRAAGTQTPPAQSQPVASTPTAPPAARPAAARTAAATASAATSVVEVDASRIASLLHKLHETATQDQHSVLPFFIKAAIEALQVVPSIGAAHHDGTVTYSDTVNIGVEVGTPGGLIVPVIQQAAELNASGLTHRLAELTTNTQRGALTPADLSAATLTVCDGDAAGVLVDTASFTPPQTARLVVGALVKRPVVVTDEEAGDVIAVRTIAYVTLVYDNRVIDSASAGRFLTTMKKRIENSDFDSDFGL